MFGLSQLLRYRRHRKAILELRIRQLDSADRGEYISESDVRAYSQSLIAELTDELLEIYQLEIDAKIISIKRGSWSVFLSILFLGILNYKTFIESLELIVSHADRIINRILEDTRHNSENWTAHMISRRPMITHETVRRRRNPPPTILFTDVELIQSGSRAKLSHSVGFLVFLILFSIVETAIIIALVYNAVFSMYLN